MENIEKVAECIQLQTIYLLPILFAHWYLRSSIFMAAFKTTQITN